MTANSRFALLQLEMLYQQWSHKLNAEQPLPSSMQIEDKDMSTRLPCNESQFSSTTALCCADTSKQTWPVEIQYAPLLTSNVDHEVGT